jgi:hypothetical protein
MRIIEQLQQPEVQASSTPQPLGLARIQLPIHPADLGIPGSGKTLV